MTYDLYTSGPPQVAMERLAEAIAAVDPTAISVPYWYEGAEAD